MCDGTRPAQAVPATGVQPRPLGRNVPKRSRSMPRRRGAACAGACATLPESVLPFSTLAAARYERVPALLSRRSTCKPLLSKSLQVGTGRAADHKF